MNGGEGGQSVCVCGWGVTLCNVFPFSIFTMQLLRKNLTYKNPK